MPGRGLHDANLFIGYLLSPTPLTSAMGAILAVAAERFVLLVTPGVADEIVRRVAERPDLAARITSADQEVPDVVKTGSSHQRQRGSLPGPDRC